ncbi:MAG: hypothetical protein IJW14_04460 [Oscillospiraceae bacterium]|nr:hypothetical protein [Oscillospiraceae bacterium]
MIGRRLFCVLAVICLTICLLSMNAVAANCTYENGFCTDCGNYEPAVLKNGIYEIRNAGQLYWFAAKVNGGENAINGKLMADIRLNEKVLEKKNTITTAGFRQWISIGYYQSDSDNLAYNGTFDGNGKTISGLFHYLNIDYVALFGQIGSTGTVKNLGVADTYLAGRRDVAILAGMVQSGGNISDCHADGIAWANFDAGGLVAVNFGTIKDSYMVGTVVCIGSGNVGGVVADNKGVVSNCYNISTLTSGNQTGGTSSNTSFGGIAGHNSGTVRGCYNSGSLGGDPDYYGGIVGYNEGVVEDCYNTSDLCASVAGGGIAGYNAGTISECYNTGNVSDCFRHTPAVGGVVGVNDSGVVKNCYNSGKVEGDVSWTSACAGIAGESSGEITNCYNVGAVSGIFSNDGIVGYPNTGSVNNCYFLSGCADDTSVGQVMSAVKFSSGEVAYLLGEAFGQKIGVDPYPVLGGKKVYKQQGAGANGADVYTNTPPTCQIHTWQPATCTKPKTCSVCQMTSGEPLAHNIVNGTCSTCGQSACYLLGHDWQSATCEKAKYCAACGQTSGTALGHDWKAADCENAKVCRTCLKIEGTALGHDWQKATCEEPKTCTVCEKTEGAALGHSWDIADCTAERVCLVCGHTEAAAAVHQWKDANCEEPKSCVNCGVTEGQALEHDWQEATCEKPKICATCDKTEGEPLGHAFVDKWICDQDGHWHSCGCGASSTKQAHVDADKNGSCDQCSMYIGKSEADNSMTYIVAAIVLSAGLAAVVVVLLMKKK